ncbi:MAG: hypothetical protein ACYS26_15060 [Planctomycetota bacterium]|jgi:hypothetical protein
MTARPQLAPAARAALAFFFGVLLLGSAGCVHDGYPNRDDLDRLVGLEGDPDPELRRGVSPVQWHLGPAVVDELAGPQRFVPKLYATFDERAAVQLTAALDASYRWPGSEGYAQALARLEDQLRTAGFGGTDARLELRRLNGEAESGWSLASARLEWSAEGAANPELLVGYSGPGDGGAGRWMVPAGAPAWDLTGRVVFELDQVRPGDLLATAEPAWRWVDRAAMRGAAAVLSAHTPESCSDPTGAERHLDAIAFTRWGAGESLPRVQISARQLARLRDAVAQGEVRAHLSTEVDAGPQSAGSLAAIVRGTEFTDQAAVLCAHVDGLGANGNASGAAALATGAAVVAELVREGTLAAPRSSLVFLFGPRGEQVQDWLAQWNGEHLGALSLEGPGLQSGLIARALLERPADPACLRALRPDLSSSMAVPASWVESTPANGLAVVARCALHDVGRHEGAWSTTDQPFSGLGDTAEFHRGGVPAASLRRERDFAEGTSLDGLDRVDGRELKRSAVACLASGMALADPLADDLDRYLRSLSEETRVRVSAAKEVGDSALIEEWREWHLAAQGWLRVVCLGPAARAGDVLPASAAVGAATATGAGSETR